MKRLFHTIKNFFFCIKYPFWKMRTGYRERFCGYSYIWYDAIPEGWKTAFGKQLCIDMRNALKKDKILHSFRLYQVKEKYGSLRIYSNFVGENIDRVISYYEDLSECYCINCGKPARYKTMGWISYLCEECFDEHCRKLLISEKIAQQEKKNCRLTYDDIPIKIGEKELLIDMKSTDINYEKLWDLGGDK